MLHVADTLSALSRGNGVRKGEGAIYSNMAAGRGPPCYEALRYFRSIEVYQTAASGRIRNHIGAASAALPSTAYLGPGNRTPLQHNR
jgi:hypothetical protein